ncbi:MAG: pyridoxamine 5'-phosphate oxidase [Proteobacteria bacterium]|nr:MAG: pyridoxamine 5'-phosphate oxidase [Pseudomonadota bacterium]
MFDLSVDPFQHFSESLEQAKQRSEPEYNAMALATVGADQRPAVRIVYYKGIVRGGLSFYCNYESAKARAIESNNNVCVNFYYPTRWEQIRVTGVAAKLTRAESEAYFRTRARLSQLGAWASNQSQEIPDREYFEKRVQHFESVFAGQDVPCPENWGGYHIVPSEFEFWFGKNGRLHERYVYVKSVNGWRTLMRAP